MAEDFEFCETDVTVLVDENVITSRDIYYGWLCDCVCRAALEEFFRDNDVSDNSREMIHVIINSQVKNPRIDKNKVALMKLICQLSDGESCECRYSAEREGDETILESAVFSIKAVANSLPDNLKSEAAKVAAMIKFQAVFVCCRDDDLLVAKKIFSRVWCINNFQTERKYYAMLQTVLDSNDVDQVMAIGSEYTYAATLNKVKEFVKKLPFVQEEPFFFKEAKREIEDLRRKESLHGTTRKLRAKHHNRMLMPSALKNAVERLSIDPKKLHPRQNEVRMVMSRINSLRRRYSKEIQNPVSSPTKDNQTGDIIEPTEGDADHEKRNPTHNEKSPLDTSMDSEKSSDSDMDMDDNTTNRSNKDNSNQYRRNRNRENRHEPVTSSPDVDATKEFACPVVPDLGPRRHHRLRESLKPPSPPTSTANVSPGAASTSRSKRKWTEAEEDSLYLGVKLCGVGKWAAIKSTQCLNRSGVNIKDKWRNLLKSGDVKRLEKEYGAI